MTNVKRMLSWWFMATLSAGALIGGSATAMYNQCYTCEPCGCATNGGYIMCCGYGSC
jgi:hypothetical protein